MKLKIKLTEEILDQNPELERMGYVEGDKLTVTVEPDEEEEDQRGDRPPKPPHNG
jgi:hypothetical protein